MITGTIIAVLAAQLTENQQEKIVPLDELQVGLTVMTCLNTDNNKGWRFKFEHNKVKRFWLNVNDSVPFYIENPVTSAKYIEADGLKIMKMQGSGFANDDKKRRATIDLELIIEPVGNWRGNLTVIEGSNKISAKNCFPSPSPPMPPGAPPSPFKWSPGDGPSE